MIYIVCLWWLGNEMWAPTWYFALLGMAFIMRAWTFGSAMFKAGKETITNKNDTDKSECASKGE